MNQLTNSVKHKCITQFQVISVLDLKLKWRKISDWLVDYFKITPDVWAFDELRQFIEGE